MTPIGEAVNAAEHRCYRSQACATRNQEHDEDLVFDRLGRGHPTENLPGHHARQRHCQLNGLRAPSSGPSGLEWGSVIGQQRSSPPELPRHRHDEHTTAA